MSQTQPSLVFTYEVLLEHSIICLHTVHGCFFITVTVRKVATETVWPTDPKIFIIYPLRGKVC